ncbi:hypothetical protein F2Q68_00041281 [Brassica cretica]|uniref:Uncharacterized protein n=1 Tax=Brassica cretica TaxID=69181 RepID=A0A8S9MFK4_BRACR|nr:hypothetical protein F2Q68_00041281 [Brassica cretica]
MKSNAYARICFCASTTQVTRTSHLRLCLQAKRIRCDTQQPQIWLSDVPLSIRFSERTSFEKLPTTVRTIPTEMFRFRPYDQLVELANTGKQLPGMDANFCASLFDSLALAFHSKFDSYGREPRIVLVTSVNPKIVAGKLYEGVHVPQPAVPEAVALGSDASNAITCNVADQATIADDSLPDVYQERKNEFLWKKMA